MKEYTRTELIEICEKAIIDHTKWSDRDSSASIIQIGTCWALLKANCEFEVLHKGGLITDTKTIWVEVKYTDFMGFECGEKNNKEETFYLPTEEILIETEGRDWY